MFKFVPLKREHLLPLLTQEINLDRKAAFINEGLLERVLEVESFTGMWNDQVMFCAGIAPVWENRGHVWIIFNEDSKENFVPVFRALKKFLKDHPCRRIEVSMRVDLEYAKRRARLLGFKEETPLARKYTPAGDDCSIFTIVKEDEL